MKKISLFCVCILVCKASAFGYGQADSGQQSKHKQTSTTQQASYGQASKGQQTGYGQPSDQQQKSSYGNSNNDNTDANEQPMPYNFSYKFVDEDGNQQARDENADGTGAIQGSYKFANIDGIQRTVKYIADDTGFHATIETNEPGTDSMNPADVEILANPIEVPQQAQGTQAPNNHQAQNGNSHSGTNQQTRKSSGYGQEQLAGRRAQQNEYQRSANAGGYRQQYGGNAQSQQKSSVKGSSNYGQRQLQGKRVQQNQYKGSAVSTGGYGQSSSQQYGGNVQNQQESSAKESPTHGQTQLQGRRSQQQYGAKGSMSSFNYGQRNNQQYGQNRYQNPARQPSVVGSTLHQRSDAQSSRTSNYNNQGSGTFGERIRQTGYTKSYQN